MSLIVSDCFRARGIPSRASRSCYDTYRSVISKVVGVRQTANQVRCN